MNENTQMQPINSSSLIIDCIDNNSVENFLKKINAFQVIIKKMLVKGVDYGTIPGCGKNSVLHKPGADKILMVVGAASEYEFIKSIQDYEAGFFAFTVRCTIKKFDQVITEGLGSCNSKEDKFLTRWVPQNKLPEGTDKSLLVKKEQDGPHGKYFLYKIEADGNTLENTILKMAKKRAQIDAVLTIGALSQLFSMDPDAETTPENTTGELSRQDLLNLLDQASSAEDFKNCFDIINNLVDNKLKSDLMKEHAKKKAEFAQTSGTNPDFNRQNKKVRALEAELNLNPAQHKKRIQDLFGVEIKSSKELTTDQMNQLISYYEEQVSLLEAPPQDD